jgi:hypothetical protein
VIGLPFIIALAVLLQSLRCVDWIIRSSSWMNSDVYYYYAPEQHRAGNALRETFLFRP